MPASAFTFLTTFTLIEVARFFNIFAGLMLATSLVIYTFGLVVYFTRLGTWPNHRDQAIRILEVAVGILFVLIVLLALVQFFASHTKIALWILSGITILGFVGMVLYIALNAGEKKEEKK